MKFLRMCRLVGMLIPPDISFCCWFHLIVKFELLSICCSFFSPGVFGGPARITKRFHLLFARNPLARNTGQFLTTNAKSSLLPNMHLKHRRVNDMVSALKNYTNSGRGKSPYNAKMQYREQRKSFFLVSA